MSSQSAKGLLGIRAYALSRKERGLPGGTHQAVRKAIASSRITLVAGKIDPDAADYQWSTNTAPSTRPDSHPQQAPTAATEGNGGIQEQAEIVPINVGNHDELY